MSKLTDIVIANKAGEATGIYSVCCAHSFVIEAAIRQAKKDNSPVLIEATANQVNQFGGYTGMRPNDFVTFVYDIATAAGFPTSNIILGGDHLGPTCWTNTNADVAMDKSKDLIKSYVKAGFTKIHLDTSMQCADDKAPLTDEVVANRAAILCKVAESTAIEAFGQSDLIYIIGTEVPPPGGAKEEINTLDVTPVANVKATLDKHEAIFKEAGLSKAWLRVVGLVVQPGVEFDNFGVFAYDPTKAQSLKDFASAVEGLVFEAHSTDYQPDAAYCNLVKDHFAILKVGPQLTFAMREALFSLNFIEKALIRVNEQSNLIDLCEEVMSDETSGWDKFYPENASNLTLYRQYSFSDRIRYYWHNEQIESAIEVLFANLSREEIPLPLLSQFMPIQYKAVLNGALLNSPKDLVIHNIMQVTEAYAQACYHQSLNEAR